MKPRFAIFAVLMAFVGASLAVVTPFWGAKEPLPYDTPSELLKPGEFTWEPKVAPQGPINVVVSLDEQRAYTYRNGVLIGASTISSGKAGHVTPTGVFTTKLKDKDHHSSIYNNAAMPYTQRLTYDGVALHAGGIPGYPESHGCVHLPSEYARLLFDESPLGMTVVVADKMTFPESVDHPSFLSPVNDIGALQNNNRLFADQAFRWTPELSPVGPVSVLLSRYDARVLVLRNGEEIGRSRVHIVDEETPLGTHVFMALADSEAQMRWLRVGMVGHFDDTDTPPDPQVMQRIVIPGDFLALIHPLIQPGTTLMVTDAPVLEHTTGKEMTVLSSHPTAL